MFRWSAPLLIVALCCCGGLAGCGGGAGGAATGGDAEAPGSTGGRRPGTRPAEYDSGGAPATGDASFSGAPADGGAPTDGPPADRQQWTVVDAAALVDAAVDGRAPDGRVDASAPRDAELIPVLPGGCGIVQCGGVTGDHSCCTGWFGFVMEPHPADTRRDELMTSFSRRQDEVSAVFMFDGVSQRGTVGFSLSSPRTPRSLRVTATVSGPAAQPLRVTLEATRGASGCSYPIKATGDVDLANPMHCWGAAFVPSGMTVQTQAKGPGRSTVTLTKVEVR